MSALQSYPCACAFAKAVGDNNPWHYPRVGVADNVLYRGRFIVRHKLTGTEAMVGRSTLSAEADVCCHAWFDADATDPTRAQEAI